MKITETIATSAFRKQMISTRSEMVKYNDQIATGKRVTKASDDSMAFISGKGFENLIRRNEQYQLNAGNGLFQARTSQQALDEMQDILISMKTLTTGTANDNKNAEDRRDAARQVESMRDELIGLANVQFNDLYLFGGTNSDVPPFTIDDTAPGGVAGTSNDTALKVSVGEGSTIETSVTGVELRGGGAGSNDLFEVIEQTINAMDNNDSEGISNSIDKLADNLDHIVSLSTKIANSVNRMEFANEKIDSTLMDQNSELSRLTEADVVESMMNFQSAQTSYETVLAVQSKMMQTSLLNFLR
ncbi:MAG: hypothetical protein WD625_11475 [Balneolales bacterium]